MPQLYDDGLNDVPSYERVESFGGGMDAYTRSTLLPPDASQYLENVVIQDNLEAWTRPGADRLGATRGNQIQGLVWFDNAVNKHLITAAAGALSYWDGAAWTDMAGWTLTDALVGFAAAQGLDKILFTDGTVLRRWTGAAWEAAFGTGDTDPPAGCTVLLWHAGRMWAAGFGGTTGIAGKEADAICVSALLAYGAGDWSLTDRSFRVGGGDGDPVVGLVSLPASVPEQAVLGVLKRNSIQIIRTDPTVGIVNYQSSVVPEAVAGGLGVVGRRAFAVLGNDLLFVAADKSFRSLERMQAATAQYQVSAPLSLPIQPYVDRINWDQAASICVTRYRQLALFSVPLDNALTPNTVFAWNGRLQRWVGIWSGWTPNSFEVTRFGGVQRLVMGDHAGDVNQWKDFADQTDDATFLDNGASVATKAWTRAFLFGEPLNDKDPYHCEARFSASNALVNFTLTADGSDLATWQKDLRASAPNLPIDLPFDLTSASNTPARKGLRGLTPFNECYVKIETTSGWFRLRNVTLSAFLNTLANQ